ncbi:hypothetical protein FGO68_gene1444 [Halteria grandinella]|uniref:Cadherin domain-containing protein n=1 Tax=Halteria grandinella TaxID=5974 RepID=A0A8J8NFY3_HALGN|nr:hypothetical protein FGO68_gene1444 [Halteria grandinella]
MLIIVLDISTGVIKSVTKKYEFDMQSAWQRNLLLLDNGNILVGKGDSVYDIDPSFAIASSSYQISAYDIVAIQTNIDQDKFHIASFDSGSQKCVINVVELPSFFPLHQKQVQCTAVSALAFSDGFAMALYKVNPGVDYIYFQQGTKFYRIYCSYSSNMYFGSMASDSTHTMSFIARGLACPILDTCYSLLQGTQFEYTDRITIASVNFDTQKIVYTMRLPTIPLMNTMNGYVSGTNLFFLISKSDNIQVATGISYPLNMGVLQGLIYSPMSTCQSQETSRSGSISLSMNLYSFAATIPSFLTIPIIIVDFTFSLGAPIDIAQTQFEGQYLGQCPISAANSYQDLDTTQSVSTFQVLVGGPPIAFSITSFSANKVYSFSAPSPAFTYSIDSFNGPATSVSVDSITGQISIPNTVTFGIGIYQLVIHGLLQDCQVITHLFTLIGVTSLPKPAVSTYTITNIGPPYFTEPLLTTFTLIPGVVQTFYLPQVIDPENDKITVKVNLGEATMFASYDQNIITFRPSLNEKYKESYELEVSLTDENASQKTATYIVQVRVENIQDVSISSTNNITHSIDLSESTELQNPKAKLVKCLMKAIKVNKTGQLQLKISSSYSEATDEITKNQKNNYLNVRLLNRDDVRIKAHIIQVSKDSVISINLTSKQGNNHSIVRLNQVIQTKQELFELDLLEMRIIKTLAVNLTKRQLRYAVLYKDSYTMIQVPKEQYQGMTIFMCQNYPQIKLNCYDSFLNQPSLLQLQSFVSSSSSVSSCIQSKPQSICQQNRNEPDLEHVQRPLVHDVTHHGVHIHSRSHHSHPVTHSSDHIHGSTHD